MSLKKLVKKVVKKAVNPLTAFPGVEPVAKKVTKKVEDILAPQLDISPPPVDTLESASTKLLEQTDPLRKKLIANSESFLGGGLDVTNTPQFGALKSAVETQFGNARQNVIGGTPSGGALIDALTRLEGSRAGTLATGIGDIAERETDRAFSLATGTPLTASLGGLGAAGGIQASLANANATRDAAAKQALGFGAGTILGGK